MADSVYGILDDIKRRNPAIEHQKRMVHPVPPAESVNRREFVISQCKGKTIFDIGCAGTAGDFALFDKMSEVALNAFGVDKNNHGRPNVAEMNLDRPLNFPAKAWNTILPDVELVVAGEVIEHLSNPGQFLQWCHRSFQSADLLITVPNAFSANAIRSIQKKTEVVNVDHVCWYSWRTLKTLVERFGYHVADFKWYNGPPLLAEGIIFLCGRNRNGTPPQKEREVRGTGEDVDGAGRGSRLADQSDRGSPSE